MHRPLAPLVLVALACSTAAPASARVGRLEGTTPVIVHRGQTVRVAVRTPSLAACLVETAYADGARRTSSVKQARDGLVSWTLRIPAGAGLGRARWTVRCGVTWERTGAWLVRPAA
jgi:hypothetical protein